MWSHGGIKPFMKGISATVSRDTTFSIIYEVLRHSGPDPKNQESFWQFAHNASAAGVATLFSGPLNFVRNMQYATPPNVQPPTSSKVLGDIWNESKSCESLPSRAGFFMRRFQVGWGTMRVAVGMAGGQKIFEEIHSALSDSCVSDSQNTSKKM